LHQVALDLDVAAWTQAATAAPQVEPHAFPERLASPGLALGLLGGGVLTKPDGGKDVLCSLARLGGVEDGWRSNGHAPGLVAEGVLHHPRLGAAGADPETKTWKVGIEENRIGLAGRQNECADCCGRQFHRARPFWGRLGEDLRRGQPLPTLADRL